MSLQILLISALVCFAAAKPEPEAEQRIVGGHITNIDQYPYAAALLYSTATTAASFLHICGATILNNRAFLTAAHCVFQSNFPDYYRVRIGSANANTRGTVVRVSNIIVHPDYVAITRTNDIAVVRSASTFTFTNSIRPAVLSTFSIDTEEVAWAVGFGDTTFGSSATDDLRTVQLWTVDQTECVTRYAAGSIVVSDDMLCAGWLNFGGRGTCLTDAGGPLVHYGIVIGVKSFSIGCADPVYPGVYTRVSSYFTWIQSNM